MISLLNFIYINVYVYTYWGYTDIENSVVYFVKNKTHIIVRIS